MNKKSQDFLSLNFIIKPMFVVTWLLLSAISFFYIDQPLAYFLKAHSSINSDRWVSFITRFGEGAPYLFLFVLLFLFYRFKLGIKTVANQWLYLACCIFSSGLVCDILKYTLGRARPIELFNHHSYGFYFFYSEELSRGFFHIHNWVSFPSGHATTAGALSASLILLWPRYWKIILSFAVIIAGSRLILTQHYLSDVMVGFYLGASISFFLFKYFKNKKLL